MALPSLNKSPNVLAANGEAKRRTRASQNTQPLEVRLRARVGEQAEVELALV